MNHSEVLLIGGRAGVGKTTVGWEVSAPRRAAAVAPCHRRGPFHGPGTPVAGGRSVLLRAGRGQSDGRLGDYARAGYRRLLYTNTVSVLPDTTRMFQRAMGADVRIVRVLLTASDDTAVARRTGRELGSELEQELRSSHLKARLLDEQVPADTVRVATDGRPVIDIARDLLVATGWNNNRA